MTIVESQAAEANPAALAAAAFEASARHHWVVRRALTIGDQRVRLRFAGEHLAELLMPALAHLVDDAPAAPDAAFTIDVWESPQAPIQLSRQEWLRVASPHTAFTARDFVYLQPDSGMLIVHAGARALVCYQDIANIQTWDVAMPFRIPLNAFFQGRGDQIVHSAAVADERNAVILAGRGGSGKSSTALSCLASGDLWWIADDLCLLQDVAGPTVASLYSTVKLWHDNLTRFSDVALPTNARSLQFRNKPTFLLYPHYRDRLALRRPVKAILLPRVVAGETTRIAPATAADAWRALVPSTAAVLVGDQPRAARNIVAFVERLPAFWLDLGTNRDTIVAVLRDFLRGVR